MQALNLGRPLACHLKRKISKQPPAFYFSKLELITPPSPAPTQKKKKGKRKQLAWLLAVPTALLLLLLGAEDTAAKPGTPFTNRMMMP